MNNKKIMAIGISSLSLLLVASILIIYAAINPGFVANNNSSFNSSINLSESDYESWINGSNEESTIFGNSGFDSAGKSIGNNNASTGNGTSGNVNSNNISGSQSDIYNIQEPNGPAVVLRRTAYPGYEKLVTVCKVTDFGAIPNDGVDDASSFQNALNYARDLGGGTVWVPAGIYKLEYPVKIAASCNLAGVWYNPDTEPSKIRQGSVLQAYSGKNSAGGTALISIGTGSAIIGITIHYPEQSESQPIPYPVTLKANDTEGGRSGFPTIKYTTLVNPYTGVSFGPNWNEMGIIEHLYMTPLNKGVFANMTTDIGRIENLYISSKYYKTFDASIDQSKLITKMKSTVIGIEIQRSDWQYLYKSKIEDVNIGVKLEKQVEGLNGSVDSANVQFFDLTILNVTYGLYLDENKMASQITKLDITSDLECIKITGKYAGSASINSARLKSINTSCIGIAEGSIGNLSIMDSSFLGFKSGKYAVETYGGGLSVENCTSSSSGTIYLGVGTIGAAVKDNSNLPVTNNIGANAKVDIGTYVVDNTASASPSLGTCPVPAGNAFIDLNTKGVDRTGSKDVTSIFQSALDEASKNGGGIVYIPAGRYLLNGTISIPSGVELRGVSETGHHSNALGTVLFTTQGKGNASGTPFITLKSGAGVRGFMVWYPEQQQYGKFQYPWTISATAQNVWVVNVTVGNGWQGLYLGQNSGGHYVSYFTGFNFKNDIMIDGSNKRGYILNSHFNPHFYIRTDRNVLPGGGDNDFGKFLGQCDTTVDGAIVLGNATDEILFNSFNYRGKVGLKLINGTGGNFNGTLIGCGFDGNVTGLKIESTSAKGALFINFLSDCVPGDGYMSMNSGNVKMINSGFGAFNFVPNNGIRVNGGSLELRQMCFIASANNGALQVSGGNVVLKGAVFRHQGPIDTTNGTIFTLQNSNNCKDINFESGTLSVGTALLRNFMKMTGTGINFNYAAKY